MKRTATGLLLLFFTVFTLRIGVERTQSALASWSSDSSSHQQVFQSPNPKPKFSRIAGTEFVQEELRHSETSLYIAADVPVVCAERLFEPSIGNNLTRPPPIGLLIA